MNNELFKTYEPKRKDRFVVEFPTQLGIESFLVKKCDLPKYNKNLNWTEIEIIFYEIIPISTAEIILKLLKMKMFSFNILLLDPTGLVIEKWKIFVQEILNIDFGSMDLSSEEYLTSKILIKPKECFLIKN